MDSLINLVRGFKQCNYINHRIFTLRCIKKGLVPLSFKLNSIRKNISRGARNIVRKSKKKQLLQDRVKCIKWYSARQWGSIEASKSTKVKDRQVSKFNRLLLKNNSNGNMDEGQAINSNYNNVNNSQMQSHTCIDKNQLHSSSKGSNVSNISQGNKWVVKFVQITHYPNTRITFIQRTKFCPCTY